MKKKMLSVPSRHVLLLVNPDPHFQCGEFKEDLALLRKEGKRFLGGLLYTLGFRPLYRLGLRVRYFEVVR